MKRLYKLRYAVLSLSLLLLFNACSEEEYLNVDNPNQLALSSFYKTPQDAEFAMNVCYTPQAHGGLFGRNWFLLFNTFSDRILFETTGLDYMNINSGNGFSRNMFRDCYRMLWRSSHVMYNMTENKDVMGLEDDTYINYMAQLHAIRGMSYFFLVTIYNQPYFYDETNLPVDPEEYFGNSEPILFWDKLQTDLEYAMENLPDTWDAKNYGRITSGAAKSLLGKALLWKYYHYYMRFDGTMTAEAQADLEYAKQLLHEVIYEGPYELMQPVDPTNQLDVLNAYQSNFSHVDMPSSVDGQLYDTENNKESIWEIQYSGNRITNAYLPGWMSTASLNSQYFSANSGSFRNHEVHPKLYFVFDEASGHPAGFDRDPRVYGTMYMDGDLMDWRDTEYNTPYVSGTNNKRVAVSRKLTIPGQPSVGFGIKKYSYPVITETVGVNIVGEVNIRYIRLSDVMLLYAETCMLLGDHPDGIVEINKVRERVGMPGLSGTITPQMIMHERELELALEGHRYLDLIRWSFDPQFNIDWVTVFDGLPIFTEGKNEYLPIPLSEINVNNGVLEQNPGW